MKGKNPSKNTVFISLGANLGQAKKAVLTAANMIFEDCQAVNRRQSSLYLTAPVDSSGPDYVNMVIGFETALDEAVVFTILQKIESFFGRERPEGVVNAPRTMDCDFLIFNDSIIDRPDLIIPHPRMHQRAFVLTPLLEISPDIIIPGKGRAQDFWKNTQDQEIQKIEEEDGESDRT